MIDIKELQRLAKIFNAQPGRKYPCSNQIVICAVVANNRDKALEIMKNKGAALTRVSNRFIEWNLDNELWIWRPWNPNIRGYRFYKVIIDKDIDMSYNDFGNSILASCGFYCCSFEIV